MVQEHMMQGSCVEQITQSDKSFVFNFFTASLIASNSAWQEISFLFFDEEERLLENAYSINLPAVYNLKGKERKNYINFINPRRGLLVLGSPGSGKSFFIVENCIIKD